LTKEAAFVYLSHLDSDTDSSVVEIIRAAIKATSDNALPMKYTVPEIAITILQKHIQKEGQVESSYVNTTQEDE